MSYQNLSMSSDILKLRYYRTLLLQTKRGNSRGVMINAKPIFLIAIFDSIKMGKIVDNRILFENNLKENYELLYSQFEPNRDITPFHKPFFFLKTDNYWHLMWKDSCERKSPCVRLLRENLLYASLDNALWDLLQDEQSRDILREAVINHFLTVKNN